MGVKNAKIKEEDLKTITIVIAAVIMIASSPGSLPIVVLCSASEVDCNRFATSNFLVQATLVAEFIRLNGILRKGRKSSVNREEEA